MVFVSLSFQFTGEVILLLLGSMRHDALPESVCVVQQLDTSAKGSRGSTTDFLDSSSKIFSASNSQSNASAANAQLKSATTEGSDQPQASHDTAQGAGGEPHHYTPRDALSPSYPPEEPGSASSVNAAHMSRLETHSADTDPSRTGATDMSLHNESFNLSTAKIRLHQQATPSGARNSQVDGIRRSGHTVSAAEPAAPGPVHAVKSGCVPANMYITATLRGPQLLHEPQGSPSAWLRRRVCERNPTFSQLVSTHVPCCCDSSLRAPG